MKPRCASCGSCRASITFEDWPQGAPFTETEPICQSCLEMWWKAWSLTSSPRLKTEGWIVR